MGCRYFGNIVLLVGLPTLITRPNADPWLRMRDPSFNLQYEFKGKINEYSGFFWTVGNLFGSSVGHLLFRAKDKFKKGFGSHFPSSFVWDWWLVGGRKWGTAPLGTELKLALASSDNDKWFDLSFSPIGEFWVGLADRLIFAKSASLGFSEELCVRLTFSLDKLSFASWLRLKLSFFSGLWVISYLSEGYSRWWMRFWIR